MKMQRLIRIIIGFAVAYGALWGSEELHAVKEPLLRWMFIGAGSLLACALGFLLFLFFMKELIRELQRHSAFPFCNRSDFDKADNCIGSAMSITCGAFLFGVIASPRSTGVVWTTPWALLLIFGFLPVLLDILLLVFDTISAWRPRKA